MDHEDYIDIEYEETEPSDNLPQTTEGAALVALVDDQKDVEFLYARQNIINTIEKSTGVLGDISELAKDSGNPKVIQAFAYLATVISELNKDLLKLRESKNKIDNDSPLVQNNTQIINNNSILICSTTDLLNKLKSMKEE